MPLSRAFAEDQRLAVLENERVLGLAILLREVAERAVVEDVAVLEDLDERAALVRVRALHDLLQVLRLDVDVRATKLASAPSASAIGSNGWSTEPTGVDFVTFPPRTSASTAPSSTRRCGC
jgi:hypothetical protein